jgi:hypothetical protein
VAAVGLALGADVQQAAAEGGADSIGADSSRSWDCRSVLTQGPWGQGTCTVGVEASRALGQPEAAGALSPPSVFDVLVAHYSPPAEAGTAAFDRSLCSDPDVRMRHWGWGCGWDAVGHAGTCGRLVLSVCQVTAQLEGTLCLGGGLAGVWVFVSDWDTDASRSWRGCVLFHGGTGRGCQAGERIKKSCAWVGEAAGLAMGPVQ